MSLSKPDVRVLLVEIMILFLVVLVDTDLMVCVTKMGVTFNLSALEINLFGVLVLILLSTPQSLCE
jgi:hypothetical protein